MHDAARLRHVRSGPPRARRALVLGAGGVTAALYEVGVLRAFEELVGPPRDHFDLFLGVSAGASVAAVVAQGASPSDLYESATGHGASPFPLQQRDVLSLDLHRAVRVALLGAGLLVRAARRLALRRSAPLEEASRAQASLPAGLFTLDRYRASLERALRAGGGSGAFRDVGRALLIPATDLDSGRRVLFGEPPWDDVAIADAVAASSAIPGLFEPVTIRGRAFIDGDVGRAGHLDAVIRRGVAEIVVVSPFAPVVVASAAGVAPGPSRPSLRGRGMWTILHQAQRIGYGVRLELGVEAARARSPGVRIAVVQPAPDDETLLRANPMSFASRAEVLAAGYACGLRWFARGGLGEFATVGPLSAS